MRMGMSHVIIRSESLPIESVLSDWLSWLSVCCVWLTPGPPPLELGPTRQRSFQRALLQYSRVFVPIQSARHFV